MDKNCIFCKILQGEIKSEILYEQKNFVIIRDVAPMAKKHFLIIPKVHFAHLNELDSEKTNILSEIFENMKEIEKVLGLEDGYRLIINQREFGGQSVNHLHIHLLGGEKLSEKLN